MDIMDITAITAVEDLLAVVPACLNVFVYRKAMAKSVTSLAGLPDVYKSAALECTTLMELCMSKHKQVWHTRLCVYVFLSVHSFKLISCACVWGVRDKEVYAFNCR